MIERVNRDYDKYNGNQTKEVVLTVKMMVDKNAELDGICFDLADNVLCDDIKSISIERNDGREG